jgi:nitrogenase molybdenum-iron protein alpha/beta subunit
LILKEKEFRAWIREYDWQQYEGKAVCVYSSADAIIPTWAFMLVASELTGVASSYQIGSRVELEKILIKQNIEQLNLTELQGGRIIIKGCSDIAAPEFAMSELIKRIQPIAKSIMYGEPCSSVPIFKRR